MITGVETSSAGRAWGPRGRREALAPWGDPPHPEGSAALAG